MSFFSLIPFAKVIYTAVLVGLIAILVYEIRAIWWDSRLYVGKFSYFADGKSDDTQANAFPALVLGQHQLLRAALVDESQRRKAQREVNAPPSAEIYKGLPSTLPEVARWQTVLSDVELKIQGFDLGKLLSQIRTSISPPEEINGFVEKSGTIVRASVNWPSHKAYNGASIVSPFETGQLTNDGSVALAIAANLVWAQAADADAEFARIPREAFVAWALTWWDLRLIRARQLQGDSVSEDDKKRWTQARRLADRMIGQAPKYPEIWRLRADIIDAAYDGMATDKDKELSAEDHRRYAAAVGAALPPQAIVTEAAADPVEAGVKPGIALWIRAAGGRADTPFAARVTIAAIAKDATGQRKLLIPGYAIADESEFALGPSGPVIARAGKADIVYADGTAAPGVPGVVLATLEKDAVASNRLGSATSLKLATAPPVNGSTLTLYSAGLSRRGGATQRQGIVQAINGTLISTDKRISEPGDGGAPVLDSSGNLVAMGYAGTETGSQLLALDWVFAKHQLALIP